MTWQIIGKFASALSFVLKVSGVLRLHVGPSAVGCRRVDSTFFPSRLPNIEADGCDVLS
jgi:hypothetical protein